MAERTYHKRYYHRPRELWRDLRAIAQRGTILGGRRSGHSIDKTFQERLMLAVTEVNGCRYCAYAHTRIALAAGLTAADVEALAQGSLEGCPASQVPAILYAQHWAESGAEPDPDARQRLLDTYGQEMSEAIELSLRMIRVGNLLGNTADYILYRVSFGRWGGG